MRLIALIIFFFCVNISYGQNYLRYYELTDSAFYFWKSSKTLKADSLYHLAFEKFIGFPEDYANAAYNIWNENSEKGKAYIAKSFHYGGFIQDIEFFLEKNDIYVSKKELKKIAKANKENVECNRCQRVIMRMGRRDLWARFLFNWRIEKVDRQNCEKLIVFATKDTMMLNRFYTGIKPNLYLQPLLNHQNWTTVGDVFNDLRKYVRRGWVHREMLNFFLDEKAFFGQEFKYDSTIDRVYLGSRTKAELLIKRHFYYSATGQYSLYNPKLKKQVTIPADPNKSKEEVDELRRALFLSPLELNIKSNPQKLYPTVEELKTVFIR